MDLDFLIKQIRSPQQNLRLRQAEVVTINNDYTIDVKIAGDTGILPNVRYLSNLAPLPGYHIWVIVDNNDMLAIGHVARENKTLAPKAIRTTNQAIPNNTYTTVEFSSSQSDAWGCWSAANPTRLTIPMNGRYLISAGGCFSASNTGHREFRILLNGTTEISVNNFNPVSNSLDTHCNFTAPPHNFVQGDYLEFQVWQSSSGTLDLKGAVDNKPNLAFVHLGS